MSPRRLALALPLLILGVLADRAFADFPVTLVATWGSFGSGDGQFDKPIGIAIAPGGEVYVVEEGNGRIQEFNPDGSLIRKWGRVGSAQGEFNYPTGIAVGSDGSVYTTETGRSRCQRFTAEGQYLASFSQQPAGWFLTGVAADGQGVLYISIYGNWGLVHAHALDGTYLHGFTDPNVPFFPTAVGTDAFGHVFVGSGATFAFLSSGAYLGSWVPGTGPQIPGAAGYASDAQGNLFTTDRGNNRVVVSDALGTLLGEFGSLGSGPGQFNGPQGIAVSPTDGRIFVCDRVNNRVQIFAHTPTAAQASSWGRIKADYR
jgi:DNA-binding beta-propeller fold protein YncE